MLAVLAALVPMMEKNLKMGLITASSKESPLTPFKAPTTPSASHVGVEKDMDGFCDAGYVRNFPIFATAPGSAWKAVVPGKPGVLGPK